MADTTIRLRVPSLHQGQLNALEIVSDPRGGDWAANDGGKFIAVRAGRRFGKSTMGECWLANGAARQEPCGFFAPDYKKTAEVFQNILDMVSPIKVASSKTDGVIRTVGGGRVDFWTLNNESAGRSRKYKRVFIDESAFTNPNMMDIFKQSIKPTLLDYQGRCITASNTKGVDPENFLYQVCNEPEHGFITYHAPSWDNPNIPVRLASESKIDWEARREKIFADLKAREHPLVWKQEYEAEFVDWSGSGFFGIDKWLDDQGLPYRYPSNCDRVFAVIDSAVKTGTANDGTAVIYMARNQYHGTPLIILDWDIIQIEGDLLTTWVPTVVLPRLEQLARETGAREGSRGVWIEDKSSGSVLLQHGHRNRWPVHAISSKFTAIGKDERALSISGYHHQGMCKISQQAHDKTTQYKGVKRNHLESQVTGFHIGDKDAARRADDLLDTYVYAVALALGDNKGF